MIIAHLETRHFSFSAYGSTEEEARNLLRRAWDKHRQYSPEIWTWEELELEEDVWCQFVRLGDVYRDNQLLISGNDLPISK